MGLLGFAVTNTQDCSSFPDSSFTIVCDSSDQRYIVAKYSGNTLGDLAYRGGSSGGAWYFRQGICHTPVTSNPTLHIDDICLIKQNDTNSELVYRIQRRGRGKAQFSPTGAPSAPPPLQRRPYLDPTSNSSSIRPVSSRQPQVRTRTQVCSDPSGPNGTLHYGHRDCGQFINQTAIVLYGI